MSKAFHCQIKKDSNLLLLESKVTTQIAIASLNQAEVVFSSIDLN